MAWIVNDNVHRPSPVPRSSTGSPTTARSSKPAPSPTASPTSRPGKPLKRTKHRKRAARSRRPTHAVGPNQTATRIEFKPAVRIRSKPPRWVQPRPLETIGPLLDAYVRCAWGVELVGEVLRARRAGECVLPHVEARRLAPGLPVVGVAVGGRGEARPVDLGTSRGAARKPRRRGMTRDRLSAAGLGVSRPFEPIRARSAPRLWQSCPPGRAAAGGHGRRCGPHAVPVLQCAFVVSKMVASAAET